MINLLIIKTQKLLFHKFIMTKNLNFIAEIDD